MRYTFLDGSMPVVVKGQARWIPYGGSKTVKPAVVLRLPVGEDEMNIAIR